MRKNTVWATALSALVIGLGTPSVSAADLSRKAVVSVPALTPASEISSESNAVSSASVETQQAKEAKIQAALRKTYKFGERSESVRNLQQLLWNVKADGYYGSKTRNAHGWCPMHCQPDLPGNDRGQTR